MLKKLRTNHRITGFIIDLVAGALASLALPPLFILPAIFLIGVPVWRTIQASSRRDAALIFGGAGLGLALAKELVELHHGSIEVESVVEFGTTITLHFYSAKP